MKDSREPQHSVSEKDTLVENLVLPLHSHFAPSNLMEDSSLNKWKLSRKFHWRALENLGVEGEVEGEESGDIALASSRE